MNGDLGAEIWMMFPAGIDLDGKIPGLHKGLYGLKLAPLPDFEKVSEALADIGFISLPFDPCVFISAAHEIIVVVYVDDMTTAGSRSDLNRLIDQLRSRFKVAVKGSLKYILRIEIKHTPECMELSQHKYINNILSLSGMDNCRPLATPIDPKTSLVIASHSDPVFV